MNEQKERIDAAAKKSLRASCVKVIAVFKLCERTFEAVSFVYKDDKFSLVPAEEAIRRADKGGRVIRSEADWKYIRKHGYEIPEGLCSYGYGFSLVTAVSNPHNPREVKGIWALSGGLEERTESLDRDWGHTMLILRRRYKSRRRIGQ